MKRGEPVKLVQDHLGRRLALQLDHDAHTHPVGFVRHAGDAFELLLAHQVGDLLDHRGLVDLIGDLVDDDGEAVLADFLDPGLGTDDHAAPAFEIGLASARPAEDDTARGKIWPRHIFHELFGA